MRSWVAVSAVGLVCGCSETSTQIQRTNDIARDGGGGAAASTGGGSSNGGRSGSTGSGGRQGSGGAGRGGSTGASGAAGTLVTGGTAGTGGAVVGGAGGASGGGPPIVDAAADVVPGDGSACTPLPRSDVPDTSVYCTAELCRTANGWRVVLTDPRGFYIGHLFWILRIGDQTFPETAYVGTGLEQLAFAVSDADFAGLASGEALSAAYGMAPPLDAGLGFRGKYCGDFLKP